MATTNPNLTENPKKPALDADKTKSPDKSRDANKMNPDSIKTKDGDSCGC